jgi:hypothetical protein
VKGIEVTVKDLATGKTETKVINDDYILITAGDCYLDAVQQYSTGTVVLTVKGRKA